MYRRQLIQQLRDHFQACAPLSGSRIPTVYHRIRFDDTPASARLVILLLAKNMACFTAAARVIP
jgi:hypothetical protein